MALWSCPKCYRHNCCCQKPKHEYPSNYPPGCHWAITESWRILDSLPVGALDVAQRSFLSGMIAGALMKVKNDGWTKNMVNPKSHQFREARMHNEAGCTWPNCKCTVPDYAMSGHNRVDYCDKLVELEKNMADLGYPEEVFSMRSLLIMNGYPCSIDAPQDLEKGQYWIDNEKLSMAWGEWQGPIKGFGFWTDISDEGYGGGPNKIILDVQEAFDEFKEQHVKRSQVSPPEKTA